MTENKKRITKIERQERNRGRYSVFLDDEYSFGLDEEIVVNRNIAVDQYLAEEQIAELILVDERRRAKTKAFRYLANRDHSERELADKLVRNGFRKEVIQRLTEELRGLHFLDDESFAKSFARSRLVQKPIGRRGMSNELKKRGITESILENTLEEIYSEFDERELAKKLAEKKTGSKRNADPLKTKKNLSDFLSRRGFSWEIVEEALSDIEW